MKRDFLALPAALAAVVLLGGCNFFHRQADRHANDYKSAHESRPLEVPPDLDSPNGSAALTIPAAGAPAPAASGTVSESPAGMAATPPTVVAGSGATLSGDGLAVADSPSSTWTRVGLALERSGAATITGRDESASTYAVETTGQTTTRPGWFKRAITLGHAGNKVTAKVQLVVRVAADGQGSRVSVEGANDEASRDAARALLQTLRERLS